MKTYKNADDFIKEFFPIEYQTIIEKQKSREEQTIEHIDTVFKQELETILKNEKEEKK